MAAAVAAIAVAFVVFAAPLLSHPWGLSHDGFNGSMWATGSRSLREHGALASRLGARFVDEESVYASHPPLTYAAVAAAETVAGERPAAARGLVVAGSAAFVVLAAVMLAVVGSGRAAALFAIIVCAATPMFLVYGLVVDTPMLSLPFGAALLAAFEWVWRTRRHVGLVVAPAALCVLTSWQGVLLATVLTALAAREPERRHLAVTLGATTATALMAVVAWLMWVHGSLQPMLEVFLYRSGKHDPSASLPATVAAQWRYLSDLVPYPAWVLVMAIVAGFARRDFRRPMLVSLGVSLGYAVMFRSGALHHEYWMYWILLPLLLGIAALVHEAGDRLPARLSPWLRVVLLCALVAAPSFRDGVTGRSNAASTIAGGRPIGVRLARAEWPRDQRVAYVHGAAGVEQELPMLRYYAERPLVSIDDARLDRLARERPHHLVFTTRRPLRLVRADEIDRASPQPSVPHGEPAR